MTQWGAPPPARVPTLTEVVDWPETVQPSGQRVDDPAPLGPGEADVISVAPPAPSPAAFFPDEESLVQSVLEEVQRQIDLMVEYRLREMLTPILNRAADGIVREARGELASTLRDVVARAVAQEIARHRTR